jgi:pSer/pThr/pTyr-binding forkhead associated (FHA) protein
MDARDSIKVGRGHDSHVRITDISVSRCHAYIRRSQRGDYIVEDNGSKFGTLVQVRKPYMMAKDQINYF